jgi:hypothetical protein
MDLDYHTYPISSHILTFEILHIDGTPHESYERGEEFEWLHGPEYRPEMLDGESRSYARDRVYEIEYLASDISSDDFGDISLIYSLSSRIQERYDLEGVPDAMSEIWRFLPLLSYRL